MARKALTRIGRVNGVLQADEKFSKTFEAELTNT
jgi:hypothetical protein